MSRSLDLGLTALAPIIWGSSYIVSTQLLPEAPPLTVGFLRALPAGLLMLALVRHLPPRAWLVRVSVLGILNFTIFWSALFIAAYRLPGGVAATLGAVQPLVVLVLAHLVLGSAMPVAALGAAVVGVGGVGLLILGPEAQLDGIGVLAALVGALSMAAGTVLTRRWQPPVPPLTFAAWQLTAGGIFLAPMGLWAAPGWSGFDASALAGLVWLGVIGGAVTYVLFFRGIARLGPSVVAGLGFLSPLSAVVLGWALLGEALSPVQGVGAVLVLAAVWAGQRAMRPAPLGQAAAPSKAAASS